jgi:hypothetical protein
MAIRRPKKQIKRVSRSAKVAIDAGAPVGGHLTSGAGGADNPASSSA